MAQGIDFAWWRPANAAALDGYDFVVRYFSNDSSKNLTLAEAKLYASWGKQIIGNWESSGQGGNYAQGVSDATAALAQANACGMPADRPIIFSIDEDVTPSTQDGYYQGVASVLAPSRIGVYGSAAMCQHWRALGAGWAWRSMSTGWSGGSSTTGCQFVQTGGNSNYDYDTALVADYGGWVPGGAAAPVPVVAAPPAGTYLSRARANPFTPVAEDSSAGPKTWAAVQYVLGVLPDGVDGAITSRALQIMLDNYHGTKLALDSVVGKQTILAAQERSGANQTGIWDAQTQLKIQQDLNAGTFQGNN